MRWVIAASLRLAAAVVAAALVVLVVGTGSLRHAAVDTLPEFLPPQVQVQTEALGLSTPEVEQLITVPLEDEFNGIAFLDHLRSQSVPGLSSIELTFKPGTDIYQARQLVTERVAQGPAVVNVGTPPVMIQPLSAESRAMMIGLSSPSVSPIDLSTLARWRIRPALLAVPGVANVTIWGQRDQQLQVLVDPAKLHAKGVTLAQVINTAGDTTWTSPLTFVEASTPGADGFIDTPNQRLSVQHILPVTKPADLARMPLEETKAGSGLTLGDVATVVEDHPALRGDAVLGSRAAGGNGFLLVVEKFPGADTPAVDRGVEKAMAALQPGLAGVTVDTTVFRPADFVDSALHNVGWAALAALLLVTAWLGLCWRSWRVALVGLVALALPLVAAAWLLNLRGSTLTALTLAGLLVALVVVVDDAVTAVAALRQRLDLPIDPGQSRAALITEALLGVRRPLGWALAVLLLGSVPLLLVTGSNGALTRPAVFSYLLTVLASTAVALTVTPALSLLLLRGAPVGANGGAMPPAPHRLPLARLIEDAYDRVAPGLLRRTGAALAVGGLLTVAALAIVPQFGNGAMIPEMQDRDLLVQWQAAPGTSLPSMRDTTTRAGAELRAVPGVRGVSSDIGQALMGDQVVNVDSAQSWISIDPAADYGRTRSGIDAVLDRFPGLRHQVGPYAETALRRAPRNSVGTGNGDTRDDAGLTVRIDGTDWAQLAAQGARLRTAMQGVRGVGPVQVHAPTLEPSIMIDTNVDKAAAYGLKPGDIRRTTAVLVAGIPVGSYYQQQQIYDVAVWSTPANRSNIDDIRALLLDTPSGGQVALKDVATVSIKPVPTEIDHDQASRFVDVTATVRGQDLGDTVSRVREAIRAVPMPLGYHAEVASGLQQEQNHSLTLILVTLACLAGALLLFQAAFRSWGRALLLLLTLPLSLAGGALTALIAGSSLTAGALLGFLAVFALAVRNGVLLLSRAGHYRAEPEGPPSAEGAHPYDVGQEGVLTVHQPATPALRAARELCFPTVVGAVALLLAFLPFTVRGDIPGMELLRPLALVVLGGVVSSTLVTLYLLPALYPLATGRRTAEVE